MERFAQQGRLSFFAVGQFLPTAEAGGFPAEDQGELFR